MILTINHPTGISDVTPVARLTNLNIDDGFKIIPLNSNTDLIFVLSGETKPWHVSFTNDKKAIPIEREAKNESQTEMAIPTEDKPINPTIEPTNQE